MNIFQFSMPGTAFPGMTGVDDMEVTQVGEQRFLYTASRFDGSISVLQLVEGGSPVFLESISGALSVDNLVATDITTAFIGGESTLFHTTGENNNAAMRVLSEVGHVGSPTYQQISDSGEGDAPAPLQYSLSLNIQGNSFLVASQFGQAGLRVMSVSDTAQLEQVDHIDDTPTSHLGDVTALASAEFEGSTYVFAVSGEDAGLTSYRVDRDGSLSEATTLAAGNDLWVTAPTEIETVKVGGNFFVILGAAGSSSLTVLSLKSGGQMEVVEHLNDDAGTHFYRLSALEIVPLGDRALVLAGGGDDGVSIFEMDGTGQLHLVGELTNKDGISMSDITSIRASVIGDEVQVFIANGSGGETSRATIDVSQMGVSETGGQYNDVLNGGALDDILIGNAGNDELNGSDGADRLIDGEGSDLMIGGAGADTFVLAADGEQDEISDFENGVDRIDVSGWPLIYDMSRLTITQHGDMVRISYFDEEIHVYGKDGSPLYVADFDASDFVF